MALSIKTKIWLPAIALSIGLVLMSTGSAVRTVKSQAITVKEQSDQQSKLELASRWRGLVEAQALRTLGAALASDEASAALLQGGQEQALQELTQVQSSLSALLTNTMERAALEAATSQAQALKASLDAAQKLKAAGDAAALQAHIQGDTQGKLKALQSAQQDMVRLTERGATELRDKAGNERLKTVWGVAGIMAIIIAAVCIGTRLVQRSVTEPLADIVQVTRSIGEGDLTVRIVTDRQDEMGEVLRALAQMSNSLAELVGQVQRSAGSIGAASVEIAHGNHDLSNRTEATAANLQRASSTLDHLNGVVGQSAASAREANALCRRAGARLCGGGQRGALAGRALGRGRTRGQGADLRLGGERGSRHGAGGPRRADHAGDRAVGAARQRHHRGDFCQLRRTKQPHAAGELHRGRAGANDPAERSAGGRKCSGCRCHERAGRRARTAGGALQAGRGGAPVFLRTIARAADQKLVREGRSL
ncbi:MAG: hypothetical protein B7X79_12975 [Acidovorax sp. 17-64-282]|nr:MAG: hypothetical protein B7X79_12975 [Acidovorax sp. 17-64-282]